MDDIDVDNPTGEDFFKAETFMYRMYKYVDADRLDINRVRTLLSSIISVCKIRSIWTSQKDE